MSEVLSSVNVSTKPSISGSTDSTCQPSISSMETSSEAIAKEFESAVGTPNKVDWKPKQHLAATVKTGHGR